MRRRLDLAASIVGRPEWSSSTSRRPDWTRQARRAVAVVRGLSDDGVTVLLTTQYLEEADALADDITVIDQGRVIASGTPAELKREVGGQTIAVRPDDPADTDAAAHPGRGHRPRPRTLHPGVLIVPVDSDRTSSRSPPGCANAASGSSSCRCACPASTRSSSP